MNHAVVTLDETGSMRGQEERVVSALNQYVNALPKDTDLTVFKFDSKRWVTQFAGIAKDWKPLTLKDYRPGAWTPLYDAIAWTIHHAESLASDGDKVVVVIDTDGRENSSREFDHAACQRMIRDKKKAGWEFVFMASGINDRAAASVGATGQSLGMTVNTAAYRARRRNYATASKQTLSYFSGNTPTSTSQAARNVVDRKSARRRSDRNAEVTASGQRSIF